MARTAEAVVYYIQDILDVKRDGKWGPRTESAYELATGGVRDEVDSVLVREGYSAASLKRVTYDLKSPDFKLRPGAYIKQSGMGQSTVSVAAPVVVKKAVKMEPSVTGPRWISEADLDRMIEQVANRQAVDRTVLKGFINYEANQRVNSKGREYDTQSVSPNGAYKGLGQMGASSWSDVKSMIGGAGFDKVFDPMTNLMATAAYMRKNQSYARAKGYTGPFTAAVAYTMHNQGAGGFMRLLKGGAIEGKQSRQANAVVAQAIADGRGNLA